MPHFSSCFHFCQFTPGEIEASLITLRLLKLILVCNIKSFAWTSRNREVLRCHLREERLKKKKEKNLGSGYGGSCLCWDVSFEACYVTWVQPHKSSAHFCILENPCVWHHPKRKKCLSRLTRSWKMVAEEHPVQVVSLQDLIKELLKPSVYQIPENSCDRARHHA